MENLNEIPKYHNKVYCSDCGSEYSCISDNGRNIYICSSKQMHRAAGCNSCDVNEEIIDEKVQEYLENSDLYVSALKAYHMDFLYFIAYRLITDAEDAVTDTAHLNEVMPNRVENHNKILSIKQKIEYVQAIPTRFSGINELLGHIRIYAHGQDINIVFNIDLKFSVFDEKYADDFNHGDNEKYKRVYNEYLNENELMKGCARNGKLGV